LSASLRSGVAWIIRTSLRRSWKPRRPEGLRLA
jgi:hypothetical protein